MLVLELTFKWDLAFPILPLADLAEVFSPILKKFKRGASCENT